MMLSGMHTERKGWDYMGMKKIYEEIAKKHGISADEVERNI